MWNYLRLHEALVIRALAGELDPPELEELLTFHQRQIERMQHERLIHLIVTLFVALYLLLTVGFAVLASSLPATALLLLLLALTAAYLVHYHRLENGVQRWYHLANRMESRLRRFEACYEPGRRITRSREEADNRRDLEQ